MRKAALAVLACFTLAAGSATAAPPDSALRVMSFNIRYDNPGDGEHAWPHRMDRVASVVRFHAPDAVGMQEALRHQIDSLAARLPGYAWVGVGRDDGADGGEFSPVFYRTDRLELVTHGTFWLSPTPETPGSVGWDAALPRVATWARFRDRTTGGTFLFLNTHFDHRGREAREQSALLVADRLFAIADGAPVIAVGDFNAPPDTPVYATLTERLADARAAAEIPPHGPESTFFGFTVEPDETGPRLDYVFTGPGVRVRRFATLTDQWLGRYPSDHLPVFAEIDLHD